MVSKFFNKKTGSWAIATRKVKVSVKEQFAEELHTHVTKKFKGKKIYVKFKGNIWTAHLTEMDSLSSKNKNVIYLLCVTDVFTKNSWVKHLKDKKGKIVLNVSFEVVEESNRKTNKLWVDQGREFYNKLMQEQLDKNDIWMYSSHDERKWVIAERFIKTLKAKIYKKMTANNSKSYLLYLNKSIDLIIALIIKNTVNADYSTFTEKDWKKKS